MSVPSDKTDTVAPSTATLLPEASIRELAREAHWRQIPEWVRFVGISLKGQRGLCHGRDEVLKVIGSYFGRRWLAEGDNAP